LHGMMQVSMLNISRLFLRYYSFSLSASAAWDKSRIASTRYIIDSYISIQFFLDHPPTCFSFTSSNELIQWQFSLFSNSSENIQDWQRSAQAHESVTRGMHGFICLVLVSLSPCLDCFRVFDYYIFMMIEIPHPNSCWFCS
jgi:hypothetical protein